MKILDRRTALVSSLISLKHWNHPESLSETVHLIVNHCPESFRRAVRDSGQCFLYRGESVELWKNTPDAATSTLLCPAPDLLLTDTYQSHSTSDNEDDDALEFFQSLETRLSARVAHPSVGHIGSADPHVAASWGRPVSVWPMCRELTYVWPCREKETLIYDSSVSANARLERFAVDVELPKALAKGAEVMFAARETTSSSEGGVAKPCCFLACPNKYDAQLKRLLTLCNYGL